MYIIFVLSSDQIRALSDDVLVLDRARSSSTSDTGSRFHVPDAGIRYNRVPPDVTVSGKSGIGDFFGPVFNPVAYSSKKKDNSVETLVKLGFRSVALRETIISEAFFSLEFGLKTRIVPVERTGAQQLLFLVLGRLVEYL